MIKEIKKIIGKCLLKYSKYKYIKYLIGTYKDYKRTFTYIEDGDVYYVFSYLYNNTSNMLLFYIIDNNANVKYKNDISYLLINDNIGKINKFKFVDIASDDENINLNIDINKKRFIMVMNKNYIGNIKLEKQ